MVSFGKNKDGKPAEKSRYRHDETADILLGENNNSPLFTAFAESDISKENTMMDNTVIKEVSSAQKTAETPSEVANLNEQVTKLCQEYATVNQQLEKSLWASENLSQQLEKSKKVVNSSYITLGIAGLACLLGIGTFIAGMSMQRDVDDLKQMLAAENAKIITFKQEAATKDKALDGQIALLNQKVDKIFAADNLDSVLQVTQELKKQVHALANKNLAAMAAQNHTDNHSKVSLPSLKAKPVEEVAFTKKTLDNPVAEKTIPATDASTENNVQNAKPSAPDDEAVTAKQKKRHWHHVSKKAKAQNHTEHVEKAPKLPPALPNLE